MFQAKDKHFNEILKKDFSHHFGKISFFYSVYTTYLFIITILSLFCLPYINIILFKKSAFLGIILYPFCLLIIGSRLRSLGNIMHECVHNIFLKPKKLNLFFGEICAAFTFSCYKTYKKNHWNHHKYVGIKEKDPDFLELNSLGFKEKSQPTLKLFFSIISSFKFYKLYTKPVFIQIKSRSLITYIVRVFFYLILLSVIYFFGFFNFFIFFMSPYLTTYQWLKFFSDFYDHYGLSHMKNPQLRTRNHLVSSFLLRVLLFPRHDEYHLVHHMFPWAPTNKLKNIHGVLMQNHVYADLKHSLW